MMHHRARFWEQVAFSVVRSQRLGPVSSNTLVSFDKILTNVGHSFNDMTSHFVSPINATFVVMTHIMGVDEREAHAFIMVNNKHQVTSSLRCTRSRSNLFFSCKIINSWISWSDSDPRHVTVRKRKSESRVTAATRRPRLDRAGSGICPNERLHDIQRIRSFPQRRWWRHTSTCEAKQVKRRERLKRPQKQLPQRLAYVVTSSHHHLYHWMVIWMMMSLLPKGQRLTIQVKLQSIKKIATALLKLLQLTSFVLSASFLLV